MISDSVSNPFDLGYDRGSGGLDRRHILKLNYIYNMPFFANSSSSGANDSWGLGVRGRDDCANRDTRVHPNTPAPTLLVWAAEVLLLPIVRTW